MYKSYQISLFENMDFIGDIYQELFYIRKNDLHFKLNRIAFQIFSLLLGCPISQFKLKVVQLTNYKLKLVIFANFP